MNLEEFAVKLRRSTQIVFFTGAGISTESGIPDFRSPGGTWTKIQPIYFDEFLESEEARVRAWRRKKETHELYKKVKPNIGHISIGELDKRGQLLGLITQNIDGLHSRGGVDDEKLVELHGTDRIIICLDCDEEFDPDAILEGLLGDFTAPRCGQCGGFLKSATISFGQSMPVRAMQRARELSEAADVFVVVGSSLQVQPAASFPVIAQQSGAFLGIVNRDPTPIDAIADYIYQGEIGEFFARINPLLTDA